MIGFTAESLYLAGAGGAMIFSLGLGGGAAAARAFLPAFFCKPAVPVSGLLYIACSSASKGELANTVPSQQVSGCIHPLCRHRTERWCSCKAADSRCRVPIKRNSYIVPDALWHQQMTCEPTLGFGANSSSLADISSRSESALLAFVLRACTIA